ncbi:hypothetical protein A5686_15350 [Mycobacterium sp. E2479]|nr:hypothetical protein A5686_15350 [Mycobacterium sp. E2479]
MTRGCWTRNGHRTYPVSRGVRALLISGVVVPAILGAAVIAALTWWALPTGAGLTQRHVLQSNIAACILYVAAVVPLAICGGRYWVTVPIGASNAVKLRTLLSTPTRVAVIHGAVWCGAMMLLVLTNFDSPWLATTLGVSMALGAAVTTALSYWLCLRALRPPVTELLTRKPPTRPHGPGLRLRTVGAWVVGTGIPLLMLILVAASALVVDYSSHRLAVVVLALVVCALISGLFVAAFTAASTADPIDEVTRGMRRIEHSDFGVSVRVFDTTELGLLQAGFNRMARGLREREQLRDLFSRHVGREVAEFAEQVAEGRPGETEMHGVSCEVAVLFVDLVGSTRLATTLDPHELVGMLNDFFAIVVSTVEQHRGRVDKFVGDAVLAVFGAPVADPQAATHALAAARELHVLLNTNHSDLKVGIGASAGRAVAGNVGDPSRYEYTVIGDPVNEAARLTEIAKLSGGLAASGAALGRADASEAGRWSVVESKILRGRSKPTEIAVPTSMTVSH